MAVELVDIGTAVVLVRMHKKGLIANGYKSRQAVERSIGWRRLALHYRTKKKFSALTRRLVKKGLLDDHGKSMQVLSISMAGIMGVRAHLKDNPDAPDSPALILEGRSGSA